MQAPALQTSLYVQSFPSLHPAPSGAPPPSIQVCAPVVQEVTPLMRRLAPGFVVHERPAVQATLTPPALLPPSTQTNCPVEQEVVPFLQMLGLVVQALPAVQPTQLPLPSHTRLLPQLVPADLLLPSTQVIVPLEQDVEPFLQMFG